MGRKRPIVAIDGPAGSGKSTLAKMAAEQLGFIHIDTGALYRSVALATIEHGIDAADTEAVAQLCASLAIEFRADSGQNQIFLNGENVSAKIRTESVSKLASQVSSISGVRSALLSLQRSLGNQGGAVMEGRDIGTVIFPDAEVKIFLTASTEERAKRRLKELTARGESAELASVMSEMQVRDKNDSERAIAPLRKADDATELDTTGLTIDQVLQRIVNLVSSYQKSTGA